MTPRWLRAVALAWVAAFLLVGVAIPLGPVLARGIGGSLTDPLVLAVARFTAAQAALSTALAVALGLPLGLWVARASARGARPARALRALLTIPFGVPSVVVGATAIAILGRGGWLGSLDLAYTLAAVVIAHVALNAPWIALAVADARAQVPVAQIEAAETLGAGARARFAAVTWPLLRWSLASAAAQVFALCVMSFALVLVLGGGPPVETLETALYARVRGGALDLEGAAGCAIWEIALTSAPWALVLALRARARGASLLATEAQDRRARGTSSGDAWACVAVVALFTLPYLLVLAPSLARVPTLSSELARPLMLSLELAAITAVGASLTALAAVVTVRPAVVALVSLPSGLSVLVLGLGFFLAYGRFIDPFDGSLLAIAALQITVFTPIALRIFWPVAQGTRTRLLEAAATLGSSPWQAFVAVEWPRWRAPLASALGLIAATALGEVAAVSLFYSESLIPLPLVATRWLGQYRFEDAQAVSAVLFVVSAVGVAGASWGMSLGTRRVTAPCEGKRFFGAMPVLFISLVSALAAAMLVPNRHELHIQAVPLECSFAREIDE